MYVGSGDGKVYALNAATGAKVWNYATGVPVASSPAVSGGIVYVGSFDGNVYALNATTGAKVWNYTVRYGVTTSSPAVSGTVVYVGSLDGKVYAFAPTSAQVACATGTGTGTFTMSPSTAGGFTSLTASASSSVSPAPPAGLTFPDGLFSFTISGLAPRATVTVTLKLPAPLPAGSFSYWKFQSGVWSQYSSASLDSTRTIITLTFTASASGTITDPGGPAIVPPPPSARPVGGVVEPVNKLTLLTPYLAFFGVVAAVAVVIVTDRKRREPTD